MIRLRIAVDNGSSIFWVNTGMTTQDAAERYVRGIYPEAVILQLEWEVVE